MSRFCASGAARYGRRIAIASLVAGLLGGCSSDVTRFSDPFSNPFKTAQSSDKTPTASIPGYAPTAPVRSAPLAPPRPAAATASAGAVAGSAEGWSAAGGTPIVVARDETAALLSARYGVPVAALLKTNGFSSAAQVTPGTRLVIPVFHGEARIAERPSKAKETAAEDAAPAKTKAKKKQEEVAATKHAAKIKLAEAKKEREATVGPTPTPPPPAKAAEAKRPAPPPTVVASLAKPGVATDTAPTGSLPPAKAVADKPEFRWPARGRITQGFKPGVNDGINLALPEGTSVKAAEAGVVAYAGNELKGYGNMVIIRHPNGFVTAYANNSEIEVKRGEEVKRGQIIAKSGQTGNTSTPQLHFEVRKGSTPVDPTQYLAGI